MDRKNIAIINTQFTNAPRLEIYIQPGNTLTFDYLHDPQHKGTFAKVLRGQLRLGALKLPVAIKLQRDIALSKEDEISVSAKFDAERIIYQKLQQKISIQDAADFPVVWQYDVWQSEQYNRADQLPSSILCQYAPYALTPQCPHCGGALSLDEWAAQEERRLTCEQCDRYYKDTPSNRRDILQASIQKNEACQSCSYKDEQEKSHCISDFLNFFPAKILIFELLDIDLRDYIDWKERSSPPINREYSWQRYQSYLQQQKQQSPLEQLKHSLNLYQQILNSIEKLHQLNIAHLDLKPENICLRFKPDQSIQVKLIDLGLALDPNMDQAIQASQVASELNNAFTADEFQSTRIIIQQTNISWQNDQCSITLAKENLAMLYETQAHIGDYLVIHHPLLQTYKYQITHIKEVENQYILQSCIYKNEVDISLLSDSGKAEDIKIEIEKIRSFPADIFSLGMLLLGLLLQHFRLEAFRKNLTNVKTALQLQTPINSGYAILQSIRRNEETKEFIDSFIKAEEKIYTLYGEEYHFFVQELLGIILKATLRHPPGAVFYCQHRGDIQNHALSRLMHDIQVIHHALEHYYHLMHSQTRLQNCCQQIQAILEIILVYKKLDPLKRLYHLQTSPVYTPSLSIAHLLSQMLSLKPGGEQAKNFLYQYQDREKEVLALLQKPLGLGINCTIYDYKKLETIFKMILCLKLSHYPQEKLIEIYQTIEKKAQKYQKWLTQYQAIFQVIIQLKPVLEKFTGHLYWINSTFLNQDKTIPNKISISYEEHHILLEKKSFLEKALTILLKYNNLLKQYYQHQLQMAEQLKQNWSMYNLVLPDIKNNIVNQWQEHLNNSQEWLIEYDAILDIIKQDQMPFINKISKLLTDEFDKKSLFGKTKKQTMIKLEEHFTYQQINPSFIQTLTDNPLQMLTNNIALIELEAYS